MTVRRSLLPVSTTICVAGETPRISAATRAPPPERMCASSTATPGWWRAASVTAWNGVCATPTSESSGWRSITSLSTSRTATLSSTTSTLIGSPSTTGGAAGASADLARAAGERLAQRGQELGGRRALEQVARRAGGQHLAHGRRVRGARERHHDGPRAALGHGLRDDDPAAARHVHVEQQQAGLVLGHRGDRGLRGRRLGDHLEVGLLGEHRAHHAAHRVVVVGQHHARRLGEGLRVGAGGRARARRVVEDLAHLPEQLAGLERLGEEPRAGVEQPAVDHRVARVARHVEDGRLRAQRAQPVGDLAAAQPRHDHVGDEEVDRPVVVVAEHERLLGRPAHQHRVAALAQQLGDEDAHAVLVLDHEDGLGSALHHRGRDAARRRPAPPRWPAGRRGTWRRAPARCRRRCCRRSA